MGVDVGFAFYKLNNRRLEKANIIRGWNGEMCNYLNICGRCDATYKFVNLVEQFEKRESNNPDMKYYAYLLLNHSELDGYEDHSNEKENNNLFKKYFYMDIDVFKNHFDFDNAQINHDNFLKKLNDELYCMQKEIESLRVHQENAKTKAAFDGFEERINELKEDISHTKECIKDFEEDDYEYNHYMRIKEDLEKVNEIIKNDKDVIVVAYQSY